MSKQNVRSRPFAEIRVHRRAIDGVAARWIAAVGPIEEPIFQIELEIDRLRQTIEQSFDIGPVRGVSPFGMSIFARKMRPLPALAGPFCVQ